MTHDASLRVPVAVVGVSGYSGAELLRLALGHPGLDVVGVFGSSGGSADRSVADMHPALRGMTELRIEQADPAAIAASEAEAVFLCTPHEASLALAPALLDAGKTVFDLSGAFRLADSDEYPRFYGFEHTRPDLLKSAVYGLAERNAPEIEAADLIAVPGCYPTSAVLPLGPLVDEGLLDASMQVIVNSVSGVSGAGRGASVSNLFCEVSLRPYGIFGHRHTPEITEHCGRAVVFTPHVAPYERGIISTIHATLSADSTEGGVRDTLRRAYADRSFVRLLPAGDWPSVKGVERTNFCDIALAVDPESRHLIVCSAIDNLVKGAAGQALQCFNLRFGMPEGLGLLPDASLEAPL